MQQALDDHDEGVGAGAVEGLREHQADHQRREAGGDEAQGVGAGGGDGRVIGGPDAEDGLGEGEEDGGDHEHRVDAEAHGLPAVAGGEVGFTGAEALADRGRGRGAERDDRHEAHRGGVHQRLGGGGVGVAADLGVDLADEAHEQHEADHQDDGRRARGQHQAHDVADDAPAGMGPAIEVVAPARGPEADAEHDEQSDVGADRRGQAGAGERHRRDAEARGAVNEEIIEPDVEQVHHQRGVEVHAGAADAVEEGLVAEGEDHRRDAEHAHAGVGDPELGLLRASLGEEVDRAGRGEPPEEAAEDAGDRGDHQRVPQHLAGAGMVTLGVAAGGHRLGAEGDRAEEAADRPEERHAEAERRLRGGREGAVVEPTDHEVVGGVDEELGDHRQHHPAAERPHATDQRKLEAQLEQAWWFVAEVGQLHGPRRCMPCAGRRQARDDQRSNSSSLRMSCSSLPAHSGL